MWLLASIIYFGLFERTLTGPLLYALYGNINFDIYPWLKWAIMLLLASMLQIINDAVVLVAFGSKMRYVWWYLRPNENDGNFG